MKRFSEEVFNWWIALKQGIICGLAYLLLFILLIIQMEGIINLENIFEEEENE